MPQLEENLDPVVVAALIDDDDDEEGKAITAAALKDTKTDDDPHHADDHEEDDDDDPDDNHQDDDPDNKSTQKPAKKDDEDDDPDNEDDPNKSKSEDDDDDDPKKDDKTGLTRQEKRAQRRADWQAKIANKPPEDPRAKLFTADPNYKPLEFKEGDELDPNALKKDREDFATNATARAVAAENYRKDEMNFWNGVQYQEKLLLADPKFKFLDPKAKEHYNEKRANIVNQGYMNLIGYKETPVTDQQGNQLLDAETKQPKVTITVERRDIAFDEYARQFMEDLEDYADERDDDLGASRRQQKRNQGIRPGGGGRKSKAKVSDVGDISKLSDEDFERMDASGELDEAIARQAGW